MDSAPVTVYRDNLIDQDAVSSNSPGGSNDRDSQLMRLSADLQSPSHPNPNRRIRLPNIGISRRTLRACKPGLPGRPNSVQHIPGAPVRLPHEPPRAPPLPAGGPFHVGPDLRGRGPAGGGGPDLDLRIGKTGPAPLSVRLGTGMSRGCAGHALALGACFGEGLSPPLIFPIHIPG